eukprot:TRINITY_DN35065_c0_g1_i1.p1 TRINITY_DN35065_c0_g1~~TRINITY_DN35065_c0_g1_i1.p1  ORF type:complete len:115 (+),score=18.55 TRINITY_DN35065_c0_g1_i1:31-375(+)
MCCLAYLFSIAVTSVIAPSGVFPAGHFSNMMLSAAIFAFDGISIDATKISTIFVGCASLPLITTWLIPTDAIIPQPSAIASSMTDLFRMILDALGVAEKPHESQCRPGSEPDNV